MFRSVLHRRLMSHNWRSVIKNGMDSFCNMLASAYTGKYIRVRNFMRAIGRLIYDWDSHNFSMITQILGINRSKSTNMT